jgi:Ca2+-binding EF-hand superfamily protein
LGEFGMATANLQKLVSSEEIRLASNALDTLQTGRINVTALKKLFGSVQQFDEESWQKIIKEADLRGDGLVDLDEFTEMMWRVITSL